MDKIFTRNYKLIILTTLPVPALKNQTSYPVVSTFTEMVFSENMTNKFKMNSPRKRNVSTYFLYTFVLFTSSYSPYTTTSVVVWHFTR